MTGSASAEAEAEVVALASELIRIDTTNTGDPDTLAGEREAAEYVAEKLSDVGYEPTYIESGAPRRGNVFVRIPGQDPGRGALLVHGHLDVVPAVASEWSVHPLSGEVSGGYLWGRGAVDMKHMVAMTLAVARRFKRDGVVPPRDLILAFVADEECGGVQGARWLAEHRPDLFEGATEAIGEVGGFSVTLGDRRAYLVQTAEKGAGVVTMRARGAPGHGSLPYPDTPVARLADVVVRLQRHRFPVVVTDAAQQLLTGIRELTGVDLPLDPESADALPEPYADLVRMVAATVRDTVNVTRFNAGYADNVVPSLAEAVADCRILPGRQEAFERELAELLTGVEWDLRSMPGAATPFEGVLADRMVAAVQAEDPGAAVLPYLMPASTDAKNFQALGIRCFGFTPLLLPPDLNYLSLFHGIDERVPVDALTFGARVLDRLLRDC